MLNVLAGYPRRWAASLNVMKEKERLGLGIILGIALLIAGTFLLSQILGDSRIVGLLAVIGWFVIAGFTIKYMGLMKK